jgi:RNA-directed DNA polymerase
VRFPRATHLVVLTRSQGEAQVALSLIRAWIGEQGLTLHPEKMHVGDCREPGQGFDFLGYRFEAGRRRVRKKSLTRFSRIGFGPGRDARAAIVLPASLPT